MAAHEEVVPKEVYQEVMADYYKGVFGLADNARGRSATAWTIASAIASALVAAGLVKNVGSAPDLVKALGVAAVFAWLATGAVFMWAVIKPLPRRPPAPEGDDIAEVKLKFVERALGFYRADLQGVQWRQRVALMVTCGAILTTIAAVGAAVSIDKSIATVSATVELTSAGQATVEGLCGAAAAEESGQVEIDSLKESNLVLEVSAVQCAAAAKLSPTAKRFDLVIPRKDVVGIETRRSKVPLF